jgi:hypothetical protein
MGCYFLPSRFELLQTLKSCHHHTWMFLNLKEIGCASLLTMYISFNINTLLLFSHTNAIMEPALLAAYLVQKSTNVAMHAN